jgi:hypothetical protein
MRFKPGAANAKQWTSNNGEGTSNRLVVSANRFAVVRYFFLSFIHVSQASSRYVFRKTQWLCHLLWPLEILTKPEKRGRKFVSNWRICRRIFPRSKSIRNLPQQTLWLSAPQNYIEVEWHRHR